MTYADVKGMFDKFNGEFFNGELPAIEIKLEKRKTARLFGQYRWSGRRNFITGESTTVSRKIRIFPIAIESGNLEETLYHEMAHYYLHHKGLPNGHNSMFKALMSKFMGRRVTNRFIQKTKQAPTGMDALWADLGKIKAQREQTPQAPVIDTAKPLKELTIGDVYQGQKIVSVETKAGERIGWKLEQTGWIKS